MSRSRISLSVLLTLLAGCASYRAHQVDDALLSEVSSVQMASVQQARADRDAAEDALAKASRDTAWADDQAELARAELKSVTQQLQEAKLAAILAERNGTTDELQEAKTRVQQSEALADATRSKLALRKREFEHMKLVEKVALERRRLSYVVVELAKARAVQELDRVAAQKVPVREFEKQVSFHRTEVALAEVRANAAAERASEARADYESAATKSGGIDT